MSCPHGVNDAAYVLGALDPLDQQSFQSHLSGCGQCRAAVQELAVMPGLLARLLPGADVPMPTQPAPDLLPALLQRVAAQRRTARVRAMFGGLAAAAAAAVLVVVLWVSQAAPQTAPTQLRMSAATGVPVEATLLVTDRGWGTSIDTVCRYDTTGLGPATVGPVGYELVAVDGSGAEVVVSSWKQLADKEITVPGSTWLDLDDIARLEVRTASGQVVLTRTL